MTLSVGLHNITAAHSNEFTHNGKKCGTLSFEDDSGQEVELTGIPPHVAKELARTFTRTSEVIQRGGSLIYRGVREWDVYEDGHWHGEHECLRLCASTLPELLDQIDHTEAQRDETAA